MTRESKNCAWFPYGYTGRGITYKCLYVIKSIGERLGCLKEIKIVALGKLCYTHRRDSVKVAQETHDLLDRVRILISLTVYTAASRSSDPERAAPRNQRKQRKREHAKHAHYAQVKFEINMKTVKLPLRAGLLV